MSDMCGNRLGSTPEYDESIKRIRHLEKCFDNAVTLLEQIADNISRGTNNNEWLAKEIRIFKKKRNRPDLMND